jgi:hypothetical protein
MSSREDEVRREFEAAMRERWPDFTPERHPKKPDEYLKAPEHCAWQGYQAALRSPAVARLVEALRAADGLAACCMAVDGYSRKELDEMARATSPSFRAALAQYATLAGESHE